MENTVAKVGATTKAVGAAGAIAAACAACCVSLPLVGPMLAWLGLSGLGFTTFGWSLPLAGAVILALGIFAVILRRRSSRRVTQQSSATSCDCTGSCKT
ncbi:MAG: hypothetical protein JWR21_2127 [Herminiimonas sp.]|nr:hypothetical protein [Herminiimonas sp.]MDB5854337.1 hypothetical protein [Herminiimonas sp.]